MDNIIARLQNSSNLRTNFPVVMELGDNHQLSQMQKNARMEVDNPAVL